MKEIKVKEVSEDIYVSVKDTREATHVVLELSTYKNLMRLQKERAIQARGLTPRVHSGYKVVSVKPWDEPHSKTRMPNDGYESWNPKESEKLNNQLTKLEFFEKRKATKKIVVPCYRVDIQTPYKTCLTEHDLDQIMFEELFEKILPKLGFENKEWPEPNYYAPFDVLWKKENGEYILARNVYRILIIPSVEDGYEHVQVYTTAPPTIPDEMK